MTPTPRTSPRRRGPDDTLPHLPVTFSGERGLWIIDGERPTAFTGTPRGPAITIDRPTGPHMAHRTASMTTTRHSNGACWGEITCSIDTSTPHHRVMMQLALPQLGLRLKLTSSTEGVLESSWDDDIIIRGDGTELGLWYAMLEKAAYPTLVGAPRSAHELPDQVARQRDKTARPLRRHGAGAMPHLPVLDAGNPVFIASGRMWPAPEAHYTQTAATQHSHRSPVLGSRIRPANVNIALSRDHYETGDFTWIGTHLALETTLWGNGTIQQHLTHAHTDRVVNIANGWITLHTSGGGRIRGWRWPLRDQLDPLRMLLAQAMGKDAYQAWAMLIEAQGISHDFSELEQRLDVALRSATDAD